MHIKYISGAIVALTTLLGCVGASDVADRESPIMAEPECGGGDADADGDVCESTETTIFAGQHIDAGTATVASDGEDLIVTLTGENGWMISEFHVYAGAGPVPVNRAGAPAPGQFPYKEELDDPVGQVELRIPLEELSSECGDTLNVAIHTVMVLFDDGHMVDSQTGWAWGPNEFERAWGWWFSTEICCEPPELGCVRSKGPWREIPALWSLDTIEIGGAVYDRYALFDILWFLPVPEDASITLAHQYITAKLNEASGAGVDAQTAADMVTAEALLGANVDGDGLLGYGVFLGEAGFADMVSAAASLRAYNFGARDTPTCDPEWLQPQWLP